MSIVLHLILIFSDDAVAKIEHTDRTIITIKIIQTCMLNNLTIIKINIYEILVKIGNFSQTLLCFEARNSRTYIPYFATHNVERLGERISVSTQSLLGVLCFFHF